MISRWIKGIAVSRWGRLAASICGVALTVTMIASIGTYVASSGATMTQRAIAEIPVDWQVQAVGTDPNKIKDAIGKTTSYSALELVGYADTTGLEATTGGTTQTTGAGKILGISDQYFKTYNKEVRPLIGGVQGVLAAQQTAANLHITVGDTVTINRVGLTPVTVKIDGIVDLPNADSLFQGIGLPSGAAPQAPPDNVLILPEKLWHSLFDEQATVRPDSIQYQWHVRIDHGFSPDPNAAYTYVIGKDHNLEAGIAGSGIVGDNLAAKLGAVRADALYAKVLFLFLGLPGAALAVFLTLTVTVSGVKHRREEQVILRIYGASDDQILRLQSLEAILIAAFGTILGILLTLSTSRFLVINISLLQGFAMNWTILSVAIGLILAVSSILIPAWRSIRNTTVVSLKTVRQTRKPLWRKLYLDVLLLAVSGLEFWRTASTGYQVVLAPEGVPAVSVNYESFIAPFCLWIGAVLLAVRLCSIFMERGKKPLTHLIKGLAKNLSSLVAASLTRDRAYIIRGIVLIALTVSFAVSISLFNTTYNAQARVDAQLTNGSDVTVTAAVPLTQDDGKVSTLKSLPGVSGLQLMQHRYAYVGNDLQDLYGVDPACISQATYISDAFFQGGSANDIMNTLAKTPDGVLVSEETVNDFQLQPGDMINLRLQSKTDNSYHAIPFRFIGVVREFPTAPKDSFFVANAAYISKMTENNAYETVLMRASGDPAGLAKQATSVLGPVGFTVTDLTSVQKNISSSLTSMDLHGLTALELIYAVLLVIGSLGLTLGLGMAERRRNYALLKAIGATEKHIDSFIWSEGLLVFIPGCLIGSLLGIGIAWMLVKVLTGVFDPPPQHMAIPWVYLGILFFAAVLAILVAIHIVKALTTRPVVEELKNL